MNARNIDNNSASILRNKIIGCFVGANISTLEVLIALYLVRKASPLLQLIVKKKSQGLFLVLVNALFISILIASTVAFSMLLILVVISLVATILAAIKCVIVS